MPTASEQNSPGVDQVCPITSGPTAHQLEEQQVRDDWQRVLNERLRATPEDLRRAAGRALTFCRQQTNAQDARVTLCTEQWPDRLHTGAVFGAVRRGAATKMKLWNRKAKMDEMETLDYGGWRFLCSGEQLPSGLFQATVRYKTPPNDQIRTLVLDPEKHDSARSALQRAKELAKAWADARGGDRAAISEG